jgi:glycosyltransferase involved in cell wall biosynthesis
MSLLIVIDGGSWANVRGFGRFTRDLTRALAARRGASRLALLVDPRTAAEGEFPPGVEIVEVPVKTPPSEAASAEGSRTLRDLWAFRRACTRLAPDVVYFPAVYSYFPVAGRAPTVVTFHDAIAETLPQLVFPTRRGRLFWRLKCRAASRRAARVVTVSEASLRDVASAYRLDPASMLVIPEGVDRAIFHPRRDAAAEAEERARHGVPASARVLLAVGGLAPHKNLDRLLRAFARMRRARADDVRLVLVGGGGGDVFHDDRARLGAIVAEERLGDAAIFAGHVPDERLASLYRLADALVFPSLLEGFGLPALEAMACGTAVAASNRGSLPEVVGDAGRTFDPTSVDDLVAALNELLDDEPGRTRRAAAGLERSRRFTWERAAEILGPELEKLAAAGGRGLSRPGGNDEAKETAIIGATRSADPPSPASDRR